MTQKVFKVKFLTDDEYGTSVNINNSNWCNDSSLGGGHAAKSKTIPSQDDNNCRFLHTLMDWLGDL